MRSSWGSPKIWLGGPSSRITPASRKQILLATSRAKFISCVAMIIVMPTSVRSRTSCRTSLTSCGSSALVISSSSISFGIHRERPHDRDALLLPAREAIGELLGLVEQADAVEQLVGARLGLAPRLPARLARCERDVLQHRHVREQVVGLEDDADLLSQLVDVRLVDGQVLAVERDRAGVDRLEQVDAAEQRRLARARGADQADDVVQAHLEADVLEHLVVEEGLPDVLDVDEAVVHAAARSRASRWRIRLSVKRASGIVRSTKKMAASV